MCRVHTDNKMKILLKLSAIVTMNERRSVLHNGGMVIDNNLITAVLDESALHAFHDFDGETVNAPDLVAIPGFIQTHIHLCQTLFRGLADDLELLDWLRLRIMPYEAAHDARSMYASAMMGIAELLRSGTTTMSLARTRVPECLDAIRVSPFSANSGLLATGSQTARHVGCERIRRQGDDGQERPASPAERIDKGLAFVNARICGTCSSFRP